MTKKTYFNLFSCLLLLLLTFTLGVSVVGVARASDLTSSSFIIRDPVIGTGGGYGSSATFKMFQSEDESIIGSGSSTTFLGRYGFLYFPAEDIITSPTPSGGGGSGGGGGLLLYCRTADFNCDRRVDIFDLSILLYYIEQSGPAFAPYDLSGDGKFDLTDISILFYYWDE
ncbi:MAG TPA: dockerin type I domain-containing protein [Candidatus Paceibacterota bacterium]